MLIQNFGRWVVECVRSRVGHGSRRRRRSLGSFEALEQRTLLMAFSEFVDPNPSVGNGFGSYVVPLSTGNVVVTSPSDDAGGTDAGAVYLFNGATGVLISTLRGSQDSDYVGYNGIEVLSNGNFLVKSPYWDNGAIQDAGAVTWGSGTTGISGVVSATNSLVGSSTSDNISTGTFTELSSGNILLTNAYWDNGAAANAGAVTWINAATGVTGVVSAANSLVGNKAEDYVGYNGIRELSNGNYLVQSYYWDNGAAVDVGAVTFGSGTTGVKGVVSTSNSLVGTAGGNMVSSTFTQLSNGNFLLSNASWANGALANAGAVTWGSGTTGVTGVVSATNSLVGNKAEDYVGYYGIRVLSNGNYLVQSPYWDNGAVVDAGALTFGSSASGVTGGVSTSNSLVGSATSNVVSFTFTQLSNGNFLLSDAYWENGAVTNAGAVTWGSGTVGVTGVVSAANSLVGSKIDDYVGYNGITVLSSGNYVVQSGYWDNGAAVDAGAWTWGSAATGVKGVVSATNSLVGSKSADLSSSTFTMLSSGNYVLSSPNWDNGGATDAGAVTWGSGTTGVKGVISAANSLVGSTASDNVGYYFTALSSGNYVVRTPYWDNGVASDAGAVTWGSGTTGVAGVVSAANSLVGTLLSDRVGEGLQVLSNGNYVVNSPYWDNGADTNAGAVTWGNGTTGVKGTISAADSLIGSQAEDLVGYSGVTALSNGNYVVLSSYWDNGAVTEAGAATWGNGSIGVKGNISGANSLIGSQAYNYVGYNGITALSNGNYLVLSSTWDNGAAPDVGAVTWGSGATGVTGVVSAANSLVGSQTSDQLGSGSITALSNGNYLVHSVTWDNGAATDAGAVTWGSGTAGVVGVVSAANSLVGNKASDNVGSYGIQELSNGNFLVRSYSWDNGAVVDAGAVTFGNGTTGVMGVVSTSNSLVGSATDNVVNATFTQLSNGNFLLSNAYWDNGALANAGTVTWGSGTTGVTGVVSATNSLVGNKADDYVGYNGIRVLSNGNYLVQSYYWDNGAAVDAGAVTFGSSATGVKGVVSTSNSLVGSATSNVVNFAFTQLSNGNFLLSDAYWENGAVTNAGAVTWGSGTTGVTGVVSAANSLVGSKIDDYVGYNGITVLSSGNYVVQSGYWDNGAATEAGAATWGSGTTGVKGVVSATNSLVGST